MHCNCNHSSELLWHIFKQTPAHQVSRYFANKVDISALEHEQSWTDNRNFRSEASIPILNELYFKFDRIKLHGTPTANFERTFVIFDGATEIYCHSMYTRHSVLPDHFTQIETVNRTVALPISLSFNRVSSNFNTRRVRDTINNRSIESGFF